ncbi:MAG TPA: DUF6265 family protein [Ignavibacteria bacterium]|nr:DUF6265 family protein [Ignavibacteria bacterium]
MIKRLFKYLILILFITTMAESQEKTPMQKLLWIVDSWVSPDGSDSRSYEEWKVTGDNLYEGSSKTIKNGEVIFSEILKIENTPEGIYYVADVPHNPAPVKFQLTSVSDSSAVFENPEHDFPKKITYLLEEGNLHAFIEGPGKDGKMKKIDFYFNKMR